MNIFHLAIVMFDLPLQLMVFIYLLLIFASIIDTKNNITPTYKTLRLSLAGISSNVLNINASNIITTLNNNAIKETIKETI